MKKDIILLKRGFTNLRHVTLFYIASIVFVVAYIVLQQVVHPLVLFILVWGLMGVTAWRYFGKNINPELLPWKKKVIVGD